MITQNMYHAAYAKVKGVELGVISKGPDGKASIELKGDAEQIQMLFNEYDNGASVPAKLLIDELGYIKYLVKQRCR